MKTRLMATLGATALALAACDQKAAAPSAPAPPAISVTSGTDGAWTNEPAGSAAILAALATPQSHGALRAGESGKDGRAPGKF